MQNLVGIDPDWITLPRVILVLFLHRPHLQEQGLGELTIVRKLGALDLGQSSLWLLRSSDTRKKPFCSGLGFGVILFLKVSVPGRIPSDPFTQVPLAESE